MGCLTRVGEEYAAVEDSLGLSDLARWEQVRADETISGKSTSEPKSESIIIRIDIEVDQKTGFSDGWDPVRR